MIKIFITILLVSLSTHLWAQGDAKAPPEDPFGAALEGFLKQAQAQQAPSPEQVDKMKNAVGAALERAKAQAAETDFGKGAEPGPAQLSDLLGGILKEMKLEQTEDGKLKVNGQVIDPQAALADFQKNGVKPGEPPSFLKGLFNEEQMKRMQERAEAMRKDPEQLKQMQLMAERLQLQFGAPAPGGVKPKLGPPPAPFIP